MYGQLDVIVSFWEGLREFWAARTLFERIFLGGTLFFIFAGFTGLDGGEAKRLNEIPLEEAKSPNNPRVFFDIEIDGQKAGRIVMELFANHVPRTAENFVSKKKEWTKETRSMGHSAKVVEEANCLVQIYDS